MDYNYDKPRERKRKMMSGEIMNLHQIQRVNLHHDGDDEGLFKVCKRLRSRFKNTKFPKYKINKPMLINGRIWCKITKMKINPKNMHFIWSAWAVYDIDKRSVLGFLLIPNNLVQHNQYILSSAIALGDIIYFFDAGGYVVEFNTKDKHYMVDKVSINTPITSLSLSNLMYTNKDNIYSKRYSYNTRTMELKRAICGRLVQDLKTGRWYFHFCKKADDPWIYCHSGHMVERFPTFTTDDFAFNWDGGERKIDVDFITLKIAEAALAYDGYLFYFESQRKMFTLDFSTGAFCDIDLSEFGINAAHKCTAVIIEQYSNMLNAILLWFMVENGSSDIYIPKDIYYLIELYHGNHYDLRLYLFDQWVYDDQKLDNHSYRTSISLGVVINAFLQNADVLRKMMEKYENDDKTDHELFEKED